MSRIKNWRRTTANTVSDLKTTDIVYKWVHESTGTIVKIIYSNPKDSISFYYVKTDDDTITARRTVSDAKEKALEFIRANIE